jgi:hypothetical protein
MAVALKFFVKVREVGRGLVVFVDASWGRSEQGLFQPRFIPAFRQRPTDPCRLRSFQVL